MTPPLTEQYGYLLRVSARSWPLWPARTPASDRSRIRKRRLTAEAVWMQVLPDRSMTYRRERQLVQRVFRSVPRLWAHGFWLWAGTLDVAVGSRKNDRR